MVLPNALDKVRMLVSTAFDHRCESHNPLVHLLPRVFALTQVQRGLQRVELGLQRLRRRTLRLSTGYLDRPAIELTDIFASFSGARGILRAPMRTDARFM